MTYDVCIVGQIVRDINYLSKIDSKVQTFGGTAFYSGVTYNSLGLTTAVHTSFDVHDKPLLANYGFDKEIVLFNQEGSTTTEFNNYYSEKNKNVRFQKMKFNGSPIDGKLRKSKIYHFGPLVREDIIKSVYLSLKKLSGIKIIDAQGLIRQVQNNNVIWQSNKDAREILSNFDIIKCDQTELNYITKSKNTGKSIELLKRWGLAEIIVTNGSGGSTIYSKSEGEFNIPSFKPNRLKDTTGCGDTYAAIYAYSRLRDYPIYEAGLLASAGASLKIEHVGPLSASIERIKERIEKHYKQRSLQLIA
jgi:bifunctional ADP-heptose synthase (sugar kinase/adenylyltransferase)